MDAYAVLEIDKEYTYTNGDRYRCVSNERGYSVLVRVSDGWTLEAYGVRMTKCGEIHWNYSKGGHWA